MGRAHRVLDNGDAGACEGAAPTVADDIGAVLGGVEQRRSEVPEAARAIVVQSFDGHHPGSRGDANDPEAVVAHGRNRPGHVGPVPEAIGRVVVAVGEVPAGHVVHIPVPVVIDPVEDLPWIRPDVGGDVGVSGVDPGIDDGDDDPVPLRAVPGRLGLELPERPKVLVRLAPRSRRLVVGIVRHELRRCTEVRMGVCDVRVGAELRRRLLHVTSGGERDDVDVTQIGKFLSDGARRPLREPTQGGLELFGLEAPHGRLVLRHRGGFIVKAAPEDRPRGTGTELRMQMVEAVAGIGGHGAERSTAGEQPVYRHVH